MKTQLNASHNEHFFSSVRCYKVHSLNVKSRRKREGQKRRGKHLLQLIFIQCHMPIGFVCLFFCFVVSPLNKIMNVIKIILMLGKQKSKKSPNEDDHKNYSDDDDDRHQYSQAKQLHSHILTWNHWQFHGYLAFLQFMHHPQLRSAISSESDLMFNITI